MGFHHVAFATNDLEATHRFYSEAMGFTLVKATGLTRVGEGGGTDNEDIVVHRVPLDRMAETVAEHRARGSAIDVRILLLLGGEFLEDAAQ